MAAVLCTTAIPSSAWALDTGHERVVGILGNTVGEVTFTPLGPDDLHHRCQYLMEWTRDTEQAQCIIDEVQTQGETDCFADMSLHTIVMNDSGSPCFAWDVSAQAFREVRKLVARESADGTLVGEIKFRGPGPSLFHFVATPEP